MLTDQEIISKLKIKKNDRVLDIGGAMKQHQVIQVHTLVDAIHPKDAPYTASSLLAKNFVKLNITREKLPFATGEFDFCLCTHVLEDLTNPFLVMEEMGRVAKAGFIATPSMGTDMVFSNFDITNWMTGGVRVPGLSHHKWFFIKTKHGLKVMPKNYGILYSSDFHFTKWLGEGETQYFWKGNIEYESLDDLNIHSLIDEYERYVSQNKKKLVKGMPLVFLDNPLHLAKAYLKILLRRGGGFKYRKTLK